jgi:hypothetical protein
MRVNYDGLSKSQSTAYNPQSNGVIERVHQVLNNCIRTYEMEECKLDERDPFGPFLGAAAFAIRSTFHTVLRASPAQLVFGRDMLLPVQFKADWALIHENKQRQIKKDNDRGNARRIKHEYRPGDTVLLTIPHKQRKHRSPREGPYTIEQVNANGTVIIKRGAVSDLVNIH